MKTILTFIGISAWVFMIVALYHDNIDYAILFAIFANIFNTESKDYE